MKQIHEFKVNNRGVESEWLLQLLTVASPRPNGGFSIDARAYLVGPSSAKEHSPGESLPTGPGGDSLLDVAIQFGCDGDSFDTDFKPKLMSELQNEVGSSYDIEYLRQVD